MYLSKKLNDTERGDWHPYELETYAVIHCLETWKHLLIGTFVEIQTDHKPLTYFQSQSKVTGKIARWLDLLSEFNFKITHIPREKNVPQDALSKRPDFYDELEALITIFGDQCKLSRPILSGCPNPRAQKEMVQRDAELWAGDTFLDRIMTQVIFDDALRGELVRAYSVDPFSQKILAKPALYPQFEVSDDLIYRVGSQVGKVLYIPTNARVETTDDEVVQRCGRI